MVRGLELFKNYFKDYQDQYVLIGGSATFLNLSNHGIRFRGTKDLDIIIIAEALTQDFIDFFWDFVKDGGYTFLNPEGNPSFFRFTKPTKEEYPFMIEILSKTGKGIKIPDEVKVKRLSIDDETVSLSAIMIDDEYYKMILENVIDFEGINVVNELCLIVLKIKAYLNLKKSKDNGENIKRSNINKHKNDVFRLSQVLKGNEDFYVSESIKHDVDDFLTLMINTEVDLKNLSIPGSKEYYINQLLLIIKQIV